MELKEILSISGMPGLYKIMATRDNGLIVAALGDDKKKFVSSRQHMFTALENITIYTQDDAAALVDILTNMKKNEKSIPIVDPNSKGPDLRAYFTKILPEHDQEKVYTSDIKKIIKWFDLLDKNGFISLKEPKKAETKEKTEKETTKEPKTAKKSKEASEKAKPAKKETTKKDKPKK